MNEVMKDLQENFKKYYVKTDNHQKVDLFVNIASLLGYQRFNPQTNYMTEWRTVIISGNPSEIMGCQANPEGKIEVTLNELLTLEMELLEINPRPHNDIIKAYADGYPIEMFALSTETWVGILKPSSSSGYKYRVKPFTKLGKAAEMETRIKKTKEIDLARAKLKELEDELAKL